jgi:hypothetical protein
MGDNLLGGLLFRTTESGETVVKPLTPGAKVHLSIHPSKDKLERHVTHEQYEQGTKRRHTQKATLSPEEIAYPIWAALGPEDDPPPRVTSFSKREEMQRVNDWLVRILPRLYRKAEDRPVRILKGPLGGFLENAPQATELGGVDLDLLTLLTYYRDLQIDTEDGMYYEARETDLRAEGPRVGFSLDLAKLLVSLGNGMLMELDYSRLTKAIGKQWKVMGFEGLMRTLKRKGSAGMTNGRAAREALRKWKAKPHRRGTRASR